MLRSITSRRSNMLATSSLKPCILNHGLRFSSNQVVVSFKKVSFGYTDLKLLLDDVDFSIRDGAKVTIMGQNGAGKSSIIKLINGSLHPDSGSINLPGKAAVATAMQVMPRDCRDLNILEFFTKMLHGNESGIAARIAKVLNTVQLEAAHDHSRIVKSFSGGQQARLLLAAALIVEPDILLLDEPTNNLDVNGIAHLTQLIQETEKTIIVISHDEDFLNSFSDNVLYLDVFSKKVEQYDGDYHTVKADISKRIARENSDNAR
jgi:ATPase subunit of ABC transporter with duplicated ATPase domains